MIELVEVDLSEKLGVIPRHRGTGAPKIFPEEEFGKANPKGKYYTRTTTFIDNLDDKTQLSKWSQRMVLEGVHRNPAILRAYADVDDPLGEGKSEVNTLCDRAKDAANSGLKASVGTAYHAITDAIDAGEDPGFIPEDMERDFEAYRLAMAEWGAKVRSIERFGVLDELQAAGTADRIFELPDSRIVIGDTKTGRTDFGMGKMSRQLACYARMKDYDPVTFKRTERVFEGRNIDLDVAYIIALPEGQGRCEIWEYDIKQGWLDVQLCIAVREYRNYWNRVGNKPTLVASAEL